MFFFSNFKVNLRDTCQREPKLVKFHCPLAENIENTNFRIGSVDIYETMFPGLPGENLLACMVYFWIYHMNGNLTGII